MRRLIWARLATAARPLNSAEVGAEARGEAKVVEPGHFDRVADVAGFGRGAGGLRGAVGGRCGGGGVGPRYGDRGVEVERPRRRSRVGGHRRQRHRSLRGSAAGGVCAAAVPARPVAAARTMPTPTDHSFMAATLAERPAARKATRRGGGTIPARDAGVARSRRLRSAHFAPKTPPMQSGGGIILAITLLSGRSSACATGRGRSASSSASSSGCLPSCCWRGGTTAAGGDGRCRRRGRRCARGGGAP